MGLFKTLIPVDALKDTVMRFPLSAVCSVCLFVLVSLSIHDVIDIKEDAELFGRLMALSCYGFFWFGLAQLISEGKEFSAKARYLFALGGFILLAALVFLSSGFALGWMLALMVPAILLGISVGPYIDRRDDLSFWFYNRQTWLGALVAVLAGVLWGAGVSAALGAVDYLFGVDVDEDVYSNLWALSLIVFAPVYALSWVPSRYEYSESDCHAPAQLAFVINWVLAPLVCVYLLILYAYFIKIAFTWELPRGQLSYLVSAFGGVGVVTYLMGWPLRESGGALLRPIYKLFFPALLIPVAMQAASIYLRIDQYGVTEDRYLIALSTLWLAGLAVAYTFKRPPLKYITGSLAILLFFSAFGPFSAPNVSERSQLSRLELLLVQNEILVNGRIVKTEKEVSFEDRQSISSIVSFLDARNREDQLKAWLELDDDQDLPSAYDLTKEMGFAYLNRYQRPQTQTSEFVNLRGMPMVGAVDVRGYKLYLPRVWVNLMKRATPELNKRPWEYEDKNGHGLEAYYEDVALHIGLGGRAPVVFDVEAFALNEVKKDPSRTKRELRMRSAKGQMEVLLVFDAMNLRLTPEADGEPRTYYLHGFRFHALIGN